MPKRPQDIKFFEVWIILKYKYYFNKDGLKSISFFSSV